MVASEERRSSTWAPWLGCVPWLQTVTDASKMAKGVALGGALTADTMRSGWSPTPIAPPAEALFASMSSGTQLSGSTIAPSVYVPSGT
ncbi:hypothetical protein [Sorangium cellulosum]|uniref:Uncharacterized protein n=1 Tax=Sorangium cellulosum So0157-2 TaxID=1254432 RepID=S4XWC8_SORCE|nr:hypothetical protein [Sorangium cellulosum]AGP37502.1 hypothetical protein SCE1572_25230 [Sorangium cellulosum So0157-2]